MQKPNPANTLAMRDARTLEASDIFLVGSGKEFGDNAKNPGKVMVTISYSFGRHGIRPLAKRLS